MRVKKFDSINVVPFIDIMLVLLVIVLTTATFVAKGMIPIDLSDASSAQKIKEQKSLNITIDKDGKIYFEKEQVAKENIIKKLEIYNLDTFINMSCDKNAKFDTFVYVINILKEKDYKNFGIVTKYE